MTLAPGLLTGANVALTGAGPVAEAVAQRLGELGAAVHVPDADTAADEPALTRWAGALTPWRALVIDTTRSFADGGPARVTGTLHDLWRAVRAIASETMLAAEEPGRLVFLAPAPGAGPHAGAVRAGVENLARTLSVEWARHGLTPVAIVPGDRTPPAQIAELTAYLASPAGAYFSGCRLELGAVAPAAA